jgi:hypothetical protein
MTSQIDTENPKEHPDAEVDANVIRERKREFGAHLQEEMLELTIHLQECTTPEFGEDYLKYLVENGPKPGFFTKYQGPWNFIIGRMENIAETMQKLRADLERDETK